MTDAATGATGPADQHHDVWDVVVIGGGPAGLSGAVALARSRRRVLVVDAGQPRNGPAAHVHNVLSRDGTPPTELLAAGRNEVTGYGGTVVPDTVTTVSRTDDGRFRVALAEGTPVVARRILVATGLFDDLPTVDGLAQRWGHDVLHCPYCHGWEVRDRAIAVLASRPGAAAFALLWRQLSADVTLLANAAPPDANEREQLAARGVHVVEGTVVAVAVNDDRLTGVRLADGRIVPCEALAVQPTFVARADVLAGLGLTASAHEMAGAHVGEAIAADPTGETSSPGVWVAGNVTDLGAHVINAAAAGVSAGAMINHDLVAEDTATALERHRVRHNRMAVLDGDTAETWWDRFYADPDHHWSGEANPVLVREVSDLPPGRALDLGCGEGGDATWLAQRGWTVTAVDIARPALDRAAARAAAAGVGDRIVWKRRDLAAWQPSGVFDLVSVHYLHSVLDLPRDRILRAAAAAVAPGGVLLVVGHAGDLPDHVDHAEGEHFPTPEELLADLAFEPDQWQVERAAQVARPAATHGDNSDAHLRTDVIVRARRRPQ